MTRALLLLLALASLGLAACAGSAGVPPSGMGAAGSGMTGAAGTGAAGTGAAMCQVNILPIVPASFEGLVAGPAASVRVRGQVTGAVSPRYGWKWSVTLADGSRVGVTNVNRDDASLVEFPMASVGTYTMVVELTGGMPCMGVRTIVAARPAAKVATFRLRITPPSTELVPAQELERQVIGGTPSGGNVLSLQPGMVLSLDVKRVTNGESLPSYVRLTEARSGAVMEKRTTLGGQNTLRVAPGSYGMIVIPDGDVAPVSFPARSPTEIADDRIVLDDGAIVTGTVVDGADKPLPGATVVLRANDLVSTTGKTDDKGTFRLRARAGTFGVTVVSGLAGGGTLESKLVTGVLLDGTSAPPLGIKVQAAALATATVKLTANDVGSLTPETRVTLAAMEPLMGVASIAVGSAAPRAMASNARLTLHPQADGTVSTGPLPRGMYLMTVFPSDAKAEHDGVTTKTLDLTAGDLGLALELAKKVLLTGRLGPMDVMTSGVRLVALDEGGLPVVAEGDAGDGGVFQIPVSPSRSYLLRALPRPDQPLARASFPRFTVATTDYPFGDRNMPPALLYAGRVVDTSLQGVGTALVQAFCTAGPPGCNDPRTPVAETVTRTDGTFQLMLPDPDGAP